MKKPLIKWNQKPEKRSTPRRGLARRSDERRREEPRQTVRRQPRADATDRRASDRRHLNRREQSRRGETRRADDLRDQRGKEVFRILRQAKGPRPASQRARDQSVNLFWPLIVAGANRYKRLSNDFEELLTQAVVVFLQAVDRFDRIPTDASVIDDPTGSFAVYASAWLKGELLAHCRANWADVATPQRVRTGLPKNVRFADGVGDTFIAKSADPLSVLCRGLGEDNARRVRAAVRKLDENEARVIAAYYFEDCSQSLADLGRALGVSRESVSKVHRRALRHLAEYLNRRRPRSN